MQNFLFIESLNLSLILGGHFNIDALAGMSNLQATGHIANQG